MEVFQFFSFKSRFLHPIPPPRLPETFFVVVFAPSGLKGASSSAQREGAGRVEQCLSMFDSFF